MVDIFVVVRVGYDPVGSVRMLLVMDRWTVWKEETRLRNIVVVDMTPLPNLCPPNFTIVLAPLSQLSHGPHPSKSVRSAKMMIDDDAQTMVYTYVVTMVANCGAMRNNFTKISCTRCITCYKHD